MMRSSPATGLIGKILALVTGAILLVLGFMFSLVLLAVVAVVGLAAWSYILWKTRELRKALRERPPGGTGSTAGGQVFDGEAVVVNESSPDRQQILPAGSDQRKAPAPGPES